MRVKRHRTAEARFTGEERKKRQENVRRVVDCISLCLAELAAINIMQVSDPRCIQSQMNVQSVKNVESEAEK